MKTSWFDDHQHQVFQTLSDRTADITGMSMASSDGLQVGNYGIGGHYEPHCDYFSKDSIRVENDRIATILFYVCSTSN